MPERPQFVHNTGKENSATNGYADQQLPQVVRKNRGLRKIVTAAVVLLTLNACEPPKITEGRVY